jgi:hypothetical protein
MSCIAGVGGGVTGLVRTAQSGRRILALDGCVLRCAVACLANAGVVADTHLVLSGYGVKKRRHADFDAGEAQAIYQQHAQPAAQALRANVRTSNRRRPECRAPIDLRQGGAGPAPVMLARITRRPTRDKDRHAHPDQRHRAHLARWP